MYKTNYLSINLLKSLLLSSCGSLVKPCSDKIFSSRNIILSNGNTLSFSVFESLILWHLYVC